MDNSCPQMNFYSLVLPVFVTNDTICKILLMYLKMTYMYIMLHVYYVVSPQKKCTTWDIGVRSISNLSHKAHTSFLGPFRQQPHISEQ